MTGYVTNIEELTLANSNFRQVVFTGKYSQLVLMGLLPNEEIGMEVHPTTDQFFRVEKGQGKVIMNGEETLVSDGFAIVIPAGTQHNVINTSVTEPLKLYTIYSPPHHKDGVVHKTKAEAEADTTDHL
ncbi:cupin domain-containing protein [Candidatus Shapirobacteria bacterium CG03_land_8_20_14_0_80_39_12]|uniref:Cupin domain-containing protein n=1 Tax=Candidatus Shapirobacteria bacterium CG03_land_8_20_14_0_80_39_12 TaxID=1974879 RepID=A0A2M7BFG6_9BACT|nr:MAG: cupin domain-containing protein [Candidatus Shapirobacteria bacterium CG03_land_8_20_14_0_80_39_12]